MGARGPAPRPAHLKVVEGNPGHEAVAALAGGLKLKPEAPAEPDWSEWFPVKSGVVVPRKRPKETAAQTRAREDAAALRRWLDSENRWGRAEASKAWRRVVDVLDAQGLLASLDLFLLSDLCVTWVRVQQAERDISTNGLRQRGERGWQRNGSITTAKAYRDHFRFLVGQFGLSPVARDGMPGDGSDEDAGSPFDV